MQKQHQKADDKRELDSVIMTITDRFILLRVKKDEDDIAFIKSLKYARWNQAGFCWTVSRTDTNIRLIRSYFKSRIKEDDGGNSTNRESNPDRTEHAQNQELIAFKYNRGRVRLIFQYDKELVKLIKTLPFYSWDNDNRWWTIAHTEAAMERLVEFCRNNGWGYKYLEDLRHLSRKPKTKKEDIANYRDVPKAFTDKLNVLRYSSSTVKIYTSCFEEFINYYNQKELAEITVQEIQGYLLYLVQERQVSTSTQNQAINAIKFYYEKVLNGPRRVYYIERPRKEKTLPSVLSLEEVAKILGKVKNVKHKALLMTCYSGGLRIGEVLSLEPKDIDSSRMLIIVRGGKGKKDRVTLLSQKCLDYLREYYKAYTPGKYLFSGQMGGKYSERSAQMVLKRAVKLAGIKKHVTLHTLRHSFATHLLESGTDIRYIQGLLGHESAKTTQIYTHITTRGIDQIKNPLDSLGI